MKKSILTSFIALITTLGAYAQNTIPPYAWGTVTLDNGNANLAATLSSTTFGLVFTGTVNNPVPLNQDINIELLAGSTASSLSLITALTFANGLAKGDHTYAGFLPPGVFADISGSIYTIPNVAGPGPAYLRVDAWLGNDATYAAALADGSPVGTSGIYQSATGGGYITPPPPISVGDAMPSFLVATPEPTTLALCGLGAASLLLFRRKK